MKKNGFTPEQIIKKLWEAEVLLSKGESVGQVIRKLGVIAVTFYRSIANKVTISDNSSFFKILKIIPPSLV